MKRIYSLPLCQEPLAGALYACCLLRGLMSHTEDTREKEQLAVNAKFFEQLAIDLLTQFYETDRYLATQMLNREVRLINGRTCLEIAANAEALRFLSHISCQSLLESIWYGQILRTSWILLLLTMICPPLLFVLDYRSKEEIKDMTRIQSENDVWE